MKLILITFSLFLLASCTQNNGQITDQPLQPYDFGSTGISRYENEETVCYVLYSSAISCMPKSKDGTLSTY